MDVFCYCRKAQGGQQMVECDLCHEWFHFRCAGIRNKSEVEQIEHWFCSVCTRLQHMEKILRIEIEDLKNKITRNEHRENAEEIENMSTAAKLQECQKEKDDLMTAMNQLQREKDLLMAERDAVRKEYENSKEEENVRTAAVLAKFQECKKEKDDLIMAMDQLQRDKHLLMAERDAVLKQENSNDPLVEMTQLQRENELLTAERDSLLKEKSELMEKVKSLKKRSRLSLSQRD